MSTGNPFEGIEKSFEKLTQMVVDLATAQAQQQAQLSAAEAAIAILVASHPDQVVLKAEARKAFVRMQQTAVAAQNPRQAFEFEQLLERLFGKSL